MSEESKVEPIEAAPAPFLATWAESPAGGYPAREIPVPLSGDLHLDAVLGECEELGPRDVEEILLTVESTTGDYDAYWIVRLREGIREGYAYVAGGGFEEYSSYEHSVDVQLAATLEDAIRQSPEHVRLVFRDMVARGEKRKEGLAISAFLVSEQPYLSWCLIVRNCVEAAGETVAKNKLRDCLESLRARTPDAEIVVVDTCSRDSTAEVAKEYADVFEVYKGPRGDWDTEMPWFDDAAAARNRAFNIASGRWRGWIDADDRLVGPEEAEQLLTQAGRWRPDAGSPREGSAEPEGLEDILRQLEADMPEADCVYAPYLYQRDADGRPLVWQERERIVRWDPKRWGWREPSHEILVPLDAIFPPRILFAHLLYVHEKVFDEAAAMYAVRRHFDVLHRQYEAGERTTRRSLYLAAYAKILCPEREAEFVQDAHAQAGTILDKYESLLAAADYSNARGLYHEALESLGGAITLYSHLPDAYYKGADLALEASDWDRARDWLDKACGLTLSPESKVNPRHHAVVYPSKLCRVLCEQAELFAKGGCHEQALGAYRQAASLAYHVAALPEVVAVPVDREEAVTFHNRLRNVAEGQARAMDLRKTFQYLWDNDETYKATKLLDAIPHTIEDHPLVVEMERLAKPILEHMRSRDSYGDYYRHAEERGLLLPTHHAMMEPDLDASKRWVARSHWAAAWINAQCPTARIIDVGCFDGQSAIPMLKLCPGVSYVGLDLDGLAIDRFRENLEVHGLAGREIRLHRLSQPFAGADLFGLGEFDVAMWFEVIEHVQNPAEDLGQFARLLKRDGWFFITTPWGSHDNGNPPPMSTDGDENRDPRSHVRAYSLRSFVDALDEQGHFTPVDVYRYQQMHPRSAGDTMHAVLRRRPDVRRHVQSGTLADGRPFEMYETPDPVAFTVAAALWDWNARTVAQEGIGASEEMIIFLAAELAKARPATVYGPVPDHDVFGGVRYWGREQVRRIRPAAGERVVVSRSPWWGTTLDKEVGAPLRKILWLQDAVYADLNPEVASKYEKIVVVSDWHKEAMHQLHGVPLDKMARIYNFLLPEHFCLLPEHERDDGLQRKPHHFIYASSPDRGLIKLLQLWPRILDMWPDATLDVFYGWRGCARLGNGVGTQESWVRRNEQFRRRYEGLRYQKGVTERGMVNHVTIAKEYMRAAAWLYPTDFTETCCTSAQKARAAGCVPVTTALAALTETAACDAAFLIPPDYAEYDDAFIDGVRLVVETTTPKARRKMSEEALAAYSIDTILPQWEALLR